MSHDDLGYRRVQFPLRALFACTLLGAILALGARWLLNANVPSPVLGAIAIGTFVGFVTTLIGRVAECNCLLATLLIACIVANGFWISAHYLAYAGGILVGSVLAWKGLDLLNAFFRVCGIMISEADRPLFRWWWRKP